VVRFKRLLCNAATGTSLTLAALIAILWIRGHFRQDQFYYPTDRRAGNRWIARCWSVCGGPGIVEFELVQLNSDHWSWPDDGDLNGLRNHHVLVRSEPDLLEPIHGHSHWRTLGFAWNRFHSAQGSRIQDNWTIDVPYWFVLLLPLIAPAVRARLHLKDRRRASAGRCHACGYDLRATPERCPECGMIPSGRG
jgi:hypothetical protein